VAVLGLTVARQLFGENNPLGESIMIKPRHLPGDRHPASQGKFSWRDEDDTIPRGRSQPHVPAARESIRDTFSVEIAEATRWIRLRKTSPGSCVSA